MTRTQKLNRSIKARERYRADADMRARKQAQAKAYKQRVLLERAIAAARAEILPFVMSAVPTNPRSEPPCV